MHPPTMSVLVLLAMTAPAAAPPGQPCEGVRLTHSLVESSGEYGGALAADFPHAAVGIPFHAVPPHGVAGMVITYRYFPGDGWGGVNVLAAPNPGGEVAYGSGVSLSGDTLLVSASSSSYVYQFDGSWTQVAVLAGPGSVALGNDGVGLVQVFERHLGGPDSWGLAAELQAPGLLVYDHLGWSVDLDGDVAVAGAPDAWDGCADCRGSAFVFHRNRGGPEAWGVVIEVADPIPATAEFDHFGRSVAVTGGTLFVGAPHDGDAGPTGCCVEHAGPGCSDPTCQQTVCATFPSCCKNEWDFICVLLAQSVCDECDTVNETGAAYIYEYQPCLDCPWDLDGDGAVGTADLLALLADWGVVNSIADQVDPDGVGTGDLLALLAAWGPCSTSR